MQAEDLEKLLSAVKSHHPRVDHGRLEENFAAFLRGETRLPPDPLQRPTFWYKGLTDQPWHDPGNYPAVSVLEANHAAICEDLDRLMKDRLQLQQFRGGDPDVMAEYIRGDHSVFYFRDQFASEKEQARMRRNRQLASRTAAVLDGLPRLGEATFFSIIGPNTHLRPHYGAENLRVFTHLGVIIPGGCAIKVAGREVTWQQGKCIVFDDSYEHESWNRGDAVRTILLVELWHHELNDAEIEFFQNFSILRRADAAA
jgi:hypothetical protein